MKNLFQDLDLYKVIIILSLVLMPAVGYWAYSLDLEIEAGKVAVANALKSDGDLEEIGKYQKAIEEQRSNRDKQGGQESYSLYFQRHITSGAPRLKRVNFEIRPPREQTVTRKKAIDTLVQINFKEESGAGKLAINRDELLAILFNCESQSPIWKLRDLKIRNASLSRTSRGKAPPPELEDQWHVDMMTFAARRPLRGN